ncbi:MAG: TrmB family transcriptional regulator, partial [Halobacteriaceae archaeon]
SEESDVPMGRIYDVLNDMERRGLVRSQSAGRPQRYIAVEPEMALDKLLEQRRRDLHATLESYEETVEELRKELEATPVGHDGFWTGAVGIEDVIDLLLERLDAASEEVVMTAGKPASGFDLDQVSERVADSLEGAVERNVSVQILVSLDLANELPDIAGERYRELVAKNDNFDIRMDDQEADTVTVIDETEVCVEVPNPVNPGQAFALLNLHDSSFAKTVVQEFEPRWTSASGLF